MKNLHTNYKAVSVAAIIGASIIPALVGTATNAAPAPFVDDTFYSIVETSFANEFPGETIASTGLTDEQLAKITNLAQSTGCGSPCLTKIQLDTTGIEKLTNLSTLLLAAPYAFSDIDISNNTKLTSLAINNVDLTQIDLSNNPELTNISLQDNFGLGSLDISKNPKLSTLNIYNTNIKSLNISANPLLADLLADDDIILDTGVTCDPIVNNTTTCDLSTVSNLVGDGKQYTINDTSDYVYDKTNSRVKFNNIPTASAVSGSGATTTSPYLRVAADRPTYTPGVAPTHRVYLFFTPNNSGNSSSTSSNSSNPSAKAPNTGASTDTSNFATIAISYFLPILVGVSTSAAAFLKLKKYH